MNSEYVYMKSFRISPHTCHIFWNNWAFAYICNFGIVPYWSVETLYSTIYYSKYFLKLNIDKSRQYFALWTHKRHPIPRPFGRAMECLLWVLQQKLIVLSRVSTVLCISSRTGPVKATWRQLPSTPSVWLWESSMGRQVCRHWKLFMLYPPKMHFWQLFRISNMIT